MRGRLLAALASLLAAVVVAPPASAVRPKASVAALQVCLRDRGLYHGWIDGIAGPLTVRAVMRFQKRRHLLVDGIAGPQTRRALGRWARFRYGSRIMREGMRGWDVAVMQFLLRQRGIRIAVIDGAFGPATRRAVLRFQARRRLGADGIVGIRTRRALLVSGHRLRQLTRARVKRLINRWSRHYGVDPALARALAWVESGFQPHVRSRAGARGVMQVKPSTWNFVETFLIGRNVPAGVSGNVRIGVRYLAWLIQDFRGRVFRALAAYNQGPWSVRQRGMFRESRRFARNVLATRGRV